MASIASERSPFIITIIIIIATCAYLLRLANAHLGHVLDDNERKMCRQTAFHVYMAGFLFYMFFHFSCFYIRDSRYPQAFLYIYYAVVLQAWHAGEIVDGSIHIISYSEPNKYHRVAIVRFRTLVCAIHLRHRHCMSWERGKLLAVDPFVF